MASSGNPTDEPWIEGAYRKVLIASAQLQLPGGERPEAIRFLKEDLGRLVGAASLLSLSDDAEDKTKAYEIVSRLVELSGGENHDLNRAVDIILSRLANFPGRALLRSRVSFGNEVVPTAPPAFALERAIREHENSLSRPGGGLTAVTDFQYTLYDALGRYPSVSASAPTSAGKSYVLGLDLVRRVQASPGSCLVYLVPTRALIREVTLQVRRFLSEANVETIVVRTVPFPVAAEHAPQGAVYVLTQERLMSLLHSSEPSIPITTLMVDEAQGIGDDARGITLQSAIEAVLQRYPRAEVHFASPLTSNPELLLKVIGRYARGHSFTEMTSPVSQNIILCKSVWRRPREVEFSLKVRGGEHPLGRRGVDFAFSGGAYQRRAGFARSVTREGEVTLLFANTPKDAEGLAKALVTEKGEAVSDDPDINELIEYVREEVHSDHPLLKCLPQAVAFHYGFMPAIVRSRVEDLCKKGVLRFVCCTSTLLQGVNLPAKHIVIENPKRGMAGAMMRGDFLNLAGRAGRLLKEFHGNVWCLMPQVWEEKSYSGDVLQPITSAMDSVMSDGGVLVQKALENNVGRREVDYGEAAIGKLYCDFIQPGVGLGDSPWRTTVNASVIDETERKLKALNVTLPHNLLDRNRSVRPDRLQGLYMRLSGELTIGDCVPLRPGVPGSNDRMEFIIKVVLEELGGVSSETNKSYKFFKWLVGQWIYNTPLHEIIDKRVVYVRGLGSNQSLSAIIRELLQALERDIRYKLVKYYIAYSSVIEHILLERGDRAAAEAIEPYHVYLECGASDRVALNLIALGLSRSTALALRGVVRFPEEATPEDCVGVLRGVPLDGLGIPALCVRELEDLLGR